MRQSIFTIERRKNFLEENSKFIRDLQTVIATSSGNKYTIIEYLNRCIRYWPYRCGATGITDYLSGIGIGSIDSKEEKEFLLIMELYINLLHWAPRQENIENKSGMLFSINKSEVERESERLILNAEFILEQCCDMYVRKEENDVFPKYYISKKSAYVDAAVVAVPELKEVLLSYLDVRNSEDVEYKKMALTTIYGYLEPRRNEFRRLMCGSISEEFFASMNNFGIRHNTKTQVRMYKNKKMMVCDKLYMMAIYILQTIEVNKFSNELKEIRVKASEKKAEQNKETGKVEIAP